MSQNKRPYWITLGLIFIVAAGLALVFIPRKKKDEISLAVLIPDDQQQTEEYQALVEYLNRQEYICHEQLAISELTKDNKPGLEAYDVLWYHKPDSSAIPNELKSSRVTKKLNRYVEQGGNLLLTLDAMKYLTDLGLEKEKPSSAWVEAVDHGFGRKRGLHAYRHHPVFKGLNGGSYIFSPKQDTSTRQVGYFGGKIPENGRVIAVDWAYINMAENKKLMLEYNQGEGSVIGIGAYTLFAMENHHTRHLELFMNNVLGYMNGTIQGDRYYWNYGSHPVESLSLKATEIKLPSPASWEQPEWDLKFQHPATGNFFDVAGERMVIMGREEEGIDEIWAHPFMALRDYQIGYRMEENDSIHWLTGNQPKVKVTPNAFSREYTLEKGTLKELITTDIKKPVSAIHYQYSGKKSLSLFVRFHTNMRLMWPYSSRVIGSIGHSWNDSLNAFVFADQSRDYVCLVGADRRPVRQMSGQWKNMSVHGDKFRAIKSDQFAAGAIAQFELPASQALSILVGATNQGIDYTTSIYKDYIQHPEKIREDSRAYYQGLLREKLMFRSPDPVFNQAYRWALIGTDRFFVHTPGLGKSLVAGYGTSESGWKGGHQVSGRPGYAWYFGRDGQWSGFALDGYGDFEKVREILEIYIKHQDLNGKIFHELTTSGAVHYDASDATPLFVVLAGHYMRHSGDVDFIEQNWPSIKKAIDFCYSTDRNNDHLIENTGVGHGWVEGGHLFGGKSTLYLSSCWTAALDEASAMARALDNPTLADQYAGESQKVKEIINTHFWNPQEHFFHHSLMPDGSYLKDITVMPAIPLYYNQIEADKQEPVLRRLATNNFSSDWGVRIIPKDNERFNPRGYHTGSVWPLYTGWTALAEYKNHRPLQGYMHVISNLWVYRHWASGFVEEVLNGRQYMPGGVCAHQCWSETMGLQPLYEGMLGYQPRAQKDELTLAPALPIHWDSLKASNIRMEDHHIDMKMQKTNKGTVYTFTKKGSRDIRVNFNPLLTAGSEIQSVQVGGSEAKHKLNTTPAYVQVHMSFNLKKKATIRILHSKGIGVVPFQNKPKPGDTSQGVRILQTTLQKDTFRILLEGPAGSSKTIELIPGRFKITQAENAAVQAIRKNLYHIETRFPNISGKDYVQKQIILRLGK